ncbi:Ferredoxin-thioredoxin reductase catalytic chain, chloroplastic [Coccomyxa sp. Obi]|nr:Ferredoxin-thioredoxin reductase catalytic chain, chloroplastic [Coccomyxa sp. Obi]
MSGSVCSCSTVCTLKGVQRRSYAAFSSSRLSLKRNGRQNIATRASSDPDTKALETMRKFSEQYARRTGTYFCVDKSVTAVVIKGLAEHKDELGAPLCPCRHYDDKQLEAEQGFWNCPCVPMRERKECHCMLFLTEDNSFRGEDTTISLEEVIEATKGMSGVQP